MIDLSLLRCMRERADYDNYRGHVPLNALEARTQLLLKDIDKYYDTFNDHDTIDFVVFRDLFYNRWHRNLDDDSRVFYDRLLSRIDEPITDSVKAVMMNSLIELKFATDTGNLLALYENGEEVPLIAQVQELAETAQDKISRKEERVYETPDIDTLMQEDLDDSGLRWRLDALNTSLRPLRGGDFLIAAGRPDKGKTSFIADNATYFASQCPQDRPVLWLSNEGVRNNIIKRAIQAALNLTVPEMVDRHKQGTLLDDYHSSVGHPLAIQIEDICGWTNFEVAELVEQVNPALLIIDMIDKVQFLGMKSDARTDQKLEEMYSWFRELGIKHEYATIAASQISASACENENSQMWPDDHMLKDSKTGKQGACDTILMIGHSQDEMKKHYRYLSTPKNKLQRAGAPALRECVLFDAARSRYKELQK